MDLLCARLRTWPQETNWAGRINWTSKPGADESKCGGGGAVGSGGQWLCLSCGRRVARLLSNNHTCCSHRPRAF